MSLMEEWAKLFKNAKPRSNDNAVAGSSTTFPNFDSQLSPFRGADNWAYDDWDEDTQYPLKGGNSELGYFAAWFTPFWIDRGEKIDNLGKRTSNLMGSFEKGKLSEKRRALFKIPRNYGETKTVRGTFRGMNWRQLYDGYNKSEAGLKEYDSISLDEFKAL